MVGKEAHMATATKCLTKVLKINMGKKENLFNNCADKNGFITTCRMKLDPFPSASTKIHSKWNKNLNVTHVCFCLVITFVFIRVLFLYWFLEFHTCIYVLTEFPLHPPPPLLTWCFISCSFLFYSHWAYSLLPECMCMGIRLSYGQLSSSHIHVVLKNNKNNHQIQK